MVTFISRLTRPRMKMAYSALKILAFALLIFCGQALCLRAAADAPKVTVFGGHLDGEVGDALQTGVSASVDNAPQAHAECTMTESWTWSVGQAWILSTTLPYTWQKSSDCNGKVDPTTTDAPSSTFFGTFAAPGSYDVEVDASVTYTETNTNTGAVTTYGPYSSAGFVGSVPSTVSQQTSANITTLQAQDSAGSGEDPNTVSAIIKEVFKRPGQLTLIGTTSNVLANVSVSASQNGPTSGVPNSPPKATWLKVIYTSNSDRGAGHVENRAIAYQLIKDLEAKIDVQPFDFSNVSADAQVDCSIDGAPIVTGQEAHAHVRFDHTSPTNITIGVISIPIYFPGTFKDDPTPNDYSAIKNDPTRSNHPINTTVEYRFSVTADASASVSSGWSSDATASGSISIRATSGQIEILRGGL